jgi:hypothetical protein
VWSINFSCSLFYCWRNVKADVTCCFFVHALAFWAPILHRLHGSVSSLQQVHRVIYVQFVENMLIPLKLWTENFHKFCWLTFLTRSSFTTDGWPLWSSSCWPIFELSNSLPNFYSLITLGP